MKLIKHSQINTRYFDKNSRPSKKFWRDAIGGGLISGKIIDGEIFVDEIDFLSRENFDLTRKVEWEDDGVIDLLA